MRKLTLILWIIISIVCIGFFVLSLITRDDIYGIILPGLIAVDAYYLGWLLGYSCGSSEERAKNKPRLYLPLDKQEEQANFMVIRGGRENGKSQIMFPHPIGCEPTPARKKCANCKYFGCFCNNSYFTEHPNRFNKCKDFEKKE